MIVAGRRLPVVLPQGIHVNIQIAGCPRDIAALSYHIHGFMLVFPAELLSLYAHSAVLEGASSHQTGSGPISANQ